MQFSLLSVISLLVSLDLSTALHVVRLVQIEAFILYPFNINYMVRRLALGYGPAFLVDLHLNHAIRDVVVVIRLPIAIFTMKHRVSSVSFSFFILSCLLLDFIHGGTGNRVFIRV